MPRRLLIAALFFAIASTCNTQTFALLLERVAGGLDISISALGGLRTLENAASIAAAILVAPIVDRVPRKWLLLGGYALSVAAALTMALVGTTPAAIGYFLANGIALMVTIGTLLTLPGDFVTGRPLNRSMGLIVGAFAFAPIFVLPAVGAIADRLGWQAGFFVSAAIAGVACLLVLVLVPVRGPLHRTDGQVGSYISRYRDLLVNRPLLWILGTAIMRFAQFAGLTTFLSTVLIHRYELSLTRIGVLFSLLGVMFFLGSSGSGFALHWLRWQRVLVGGGLLAAMLFGLAYTVDPGLVVTVVAALVLAAVFGMQENASTILVVRQAGEQRGAALAWNELSAAGGSLLGIGCGSLGFRIADVTGLGAVLLLFAILSVLGSWMIPNIDAKPTMGTDTAVEPGI